MAIQHVLAGNRNLRSHSKLNSAKSKKYAASRFYSTRQGSYCPHFLAHPLPAPSTPKPRYLIANPALPDDVHRQRLDPGCKIFVDRVKTGHAMVFPHVPRRCRIQIRAWPKPPARIIGLAGPASQQCRRREIFDAIASFGQPEIGPTGNPPTALPGSLNPAKSPAAAKNQGDQPLFFEHHL